MIKKENSIERKRQCERDEKREGGKKREKEEGDNMPGEAGLAREC